MGWEVMEKTNMTNIKTIGIIGSTGFIGNELSIFLKSYDYSILQISRCKGAKLNLDLSKPNDFDYSVFNSCDYIIFTAAVSSPDFCEDSFEQAYQINVIGTKFVIEQALEHQCRVIFFSSDAVYGSDIGKAFDELQITNPTTAYGKMKKEVEDTFKDNQFFKSVRLSYVISKSDKFMNYVKNCIEREVPVEIFHPFYRNCVMLDEVMQSIIWLIENWKNYKTPFLNICGPELISRLRIVDEINRFSNNKIQYRVIYPGDEFFYVRPKITEISSRYLGEFISGMNDPFSIRLKRELSKNNF